MATWMYVLSSQERISVMERGVEQSYNFPVGEPRGNAVMDSTNLSLLSAWDKC